MANQPYPVLLFVNNNEKAINKSSFAVCLYNGVWHQVKQDTDTGEPRAFNPSPSIHHWDIPSDKEPEEEEDVEEDPEDLEEPTQTDIAIRLTPIPSRVHTPQPGNTAKTATTHKPLSPLSGMSTTVGTTTTQTTTGGTSGGSGTGTSNAPATAQSIQASLHTALRRHGAPPPMLSS